MALVVLVASIVRKVDLASSMRLMYRNVPNKLCPKYEIRLILVPGGLFVTILFC